MSTIRVSQVNAIPPPAQPSQHTRIKLATREYILNAFYNHDIAFIRRLQGFTTQEVTYLASINPIYLLTLLHLNKLNCENVSNECMDKIIDQSIRYEFPKGILFYLLCKLTIGQDVNNALERCAKLYPDIYLNLHLHINLPISAIPNVNMGTVNTLRAIRGDGKNITASQVNEALRVWIDKKMWKGEVGKALLQHHTELSGNVRPIDHPTFDETDVRVMYLKDVIPNITIPGKLTDVLLLDDKEYTVRCMAGFEITKIGLESIEVIDYETGGTRVIAVSSFAVASLLGMFSDTAALVQDFEGILLFFLMNGYIQSARHLLVHHPQHVRPFVEKYHTIPKSGERSTGCDVMYKRSYQLFLDHISDVGVVWSMVKSCDNAVFVRMFFERHPQARVDMDDLIHHPTLFNDLSKGEKKRISRHPGFVEFANACLNIGYRVPSQYISKSQIHPLSALKSGELDLLPEKKALSRLLGDHESSHEAVTRILASIPSQTIALCLENRLIDIEFIRKHANDVANVIEQFGNLYRIAYYRNLSDLSD